MEYGKHIASPFFQKEGLKEMTLFALEPLDEDRFYEECYHKAPDARKDYFEREIASARIEDYDLKHFDWDALARDGLTFHP